MSDIISIIYTIAKVDPSTVEDTDLKRADIHSHFSLMRRLHHDSSSKFNNILLGMARQLNENMASKPVNNSDIYLEIKQLFTRDSFNTMIEYDALYLVERVKVGNNVIDEPLDVWSIDTRIFKGILTKNLYLSGMEGADISRIEVKYRLGKYRSKVRLGGFDDSDTIEYVRGYNYYLSQFYRRSPSPSRKILVGHLRKAKYANELVCYNKEALARKFEFEVSAVGTLKQVKHRIKEFAEDMAFYAERMFQSAYGEDALKSTTGQGKSHYKVKFQTYDKCLQVYDKYKRNVLATESIEDDRFGIMIDREEGTKGEPERKRLDRRKDIRKHYKLALKLIKQSTQGYLS